MNKKWIYLFMLSLFILSGCASLNGNVPFQYQPSLTSANKKINKIVGLNLLVDKRPKEDISNTESIKDLPDKITSKLLEDFQKSEIFAKIHYNTEAEDEIVINGSINRFKWKATPNGLMFIPFLNLLIYFGIPTYDITGVTVITLEVKDKKLKPLGKVLNLRTHTIYIILKPETQELNWQSLLGMWPKN